MGEPLIGYQLEHHGEKHPVSGDHKSGQHTGFIIRAARFTRESMFERIAFGRTGGARSRGLPI